MSEERKVFLPLARTVFIYQVPRHREGVKLGEHLGSCSCGTRSRVYDTSSVMDEGGVMVFWVLKWFNITNSKI